MATSGQQHRETPETGGWPNLGTPETEPGAPTALEMAREAGSEINDALLALVGFAPPATEAERAARLDGDRRVVERCAQEQFDGPFTTRVVMQAYQYATPVIGHLVRTGKIFAAARRLRRPVQRHPDDHNWSADDIQTLTEQCVDKGVLDVYRLHGLSSWTVCGGANLTTYAVNACAMSFSQIYQRWWRARVLERSFGDIAVDLHERLHPLAADPADLVSDAIETTRLLAAFPDLARKGLYYRGIQDMSQAEAALQVGLKNAKALENRIGRARASLGLNRPQPSRGSETAAVSETKEVDGDQ